MPVFRISFWDRDRRTWKAFDVECPRLKSLEDYADCIARKLTDNYESAMFKKCMESIDDESVCRPVARQMSRNYYEKLLPVIEAFLETLPARRKLAKVARVALEVNEDVWATLTRREIALVRLVQMLREERPVRLGMSMRSLVAFDVDSRKYEALRDLIALGLWLCKNYGIPSIIYPTRRGFHLIGLEPLDKKRWELIYNTVSLMKKEGYFQHIDQLHITMSLARGYTTVSVSGTRDVHYLIDAVKEIESGRILGCRLWFSPVALYRERVIEDVITEVAEIRPLTQNPMWREVREKWVQLLKEMERRLRIPTSR